MSPHVSMARVLIWASFHHYIQITLSLICIINETDHVTLNLFLYLSYVADENTVSSSEFDAFLYLAVNLGARGQSVHHFEYNNLIITMHLQNFMSLVVVIFINHQMWRFIDISRHLCNIKRNNYSREFCANSSSVCSREWYILRLLLSLMYLIKNTVIGIVFTNRHFSSSHISIKLQ